MLCQLSYSHRQVDYTTVLPLDVGKLVLDSGLMNGINANADELEFDPLLFS